MAAGESGAAVGQRMCGSTGQKHVFEDDGISSTQLIHDRDTKFTKQFDDIFRSEELKIKKVPFRSPNMNAHCERVIRTIKNETLDYFMLFGEDHSNHIVSSFVE
ncbi:hypothetical protein OAG75_00995 [bacterium]|nr:hypothetical protein [Planctomicrobium sp.]MDB4793197.1 hypothetical protein [bacterium]